ncbi:CII family transcriptional regulator [Nocardia mangyaensis]|uniref:CII family transcriptional regulator n=1 Tax=Nocardia mangyaensis TaxID=2213200 RepID=UPI003461738C
MAPSRCFFYVGVSYDVPGTADPVSRWKRDWIPKFSMLLAVLEWGVVDDDMARLARQVAAILTNKKRPAATERSEQIQMEF